MASRKIPNFGTMEQATFQLQQGYFNNTETHLEAVENRTTNDVSHDSSFRIKVADFQQTLKFIQHNVHFK